MSCHYTGAFLYSKHPSISPQELQIAMKVISDSGLNPNDFCIIKNQCFMKSESLEKEKTNTLTSDSTIASTALSSSAIYDDDPRRDELFWYLGQRFFQVTNTIATELADWFQDPQLLSDWLVSQQEHMVLQQPLVSLYFIFHFILFYFIIFTH